MGMERSSVVVLDNGGGLLKAGFGGETDPIAVVPNCIGRPPSSKKWLVGDQLQADDADVTGVSLRRPIDRGYLINPEVQREVWDRVFRSLLNLEDLSQSSLLLVEPLFNPPSLQRSADELVFEEFGFGSLCVADSPSLVHLYEASRAQGPAVASLVVDCGFSFTHAAPVMQNLTLNYGVKRMDLGGKALTNYLKELVSYRSLTVMDETLLIDHAKEQLCFVSLDLQHDLRLSRKSGKENILKCTYVLPDGVTHTKGFVKDLNEARRYLSLPDGTTNCTTDLASKMGEMGGQGDTDKAEDRRKVDLTQNVTPKFSPKEKKGYSFGFVLISYPTSSLVQEFVLTNERFLVPEMLFQPVDLGMNQAGLAECIVRAVNSCHPYLHPVLFQNIILTGGSTLFPRFAQRLERELRPLVLDAYEVKIKCQENPILGVWRGGSLLASSPEFESMCVTKAEYEEIGSVRCRRRFFH
ncbi:Actin family protein [Rhynchospora pubera]|uniref:Actin-related protein 6 n=1 Tax=Rhynchospora pubera TaxID=906938 RepID=A0AAV8HUZ4_9POAL|nr:Actin family protein [Rhynchospora pubera]